MTIVSRLRTCLHAASIYLKAVSQFCVITLLRVSVRLYIAMYLVTYSFYY